MVKPKYVYLVSTLLPNTKKGCALIRSNRRHRTKSVPRDPSFVLQKISNTRKKATKLRKTKEVKKARVAR